MTSLLPPAVLPAALVRRLRTARRRSADLAIAELRDGLRCLGAAPEVPAAVRVAIRRWHRAVVFGPAVQFVGLVVALLWTGSLVKTGRGLFPAPGVFAASVDASWAQMKHYSPVGFSVELLSYAVGLCIAIATVCLLYVGPAWAGWAIWRAVPLGVSTPSHQMAKFQLVANGRRCVVACSKALRTHGERRADELHAVADALSDITGDIARAHRTCATVPWRSHRRKALKQHAALVVGAVREAEAGLDRDPEQALKEITVLVLHIMRQYADGRVGALLTDAQLAGAEAVRDREAWRVAITAAVFTLAGCGAALFHVPTALQPYLLSGLGACLVAGLYGRRTSQGLEMLSWLRGN